MTDSNRYHVGWPHKNVHAVLDQTEYVRFAAKPEGAPKP